MGEILTASQVADLLQVHLRTVYKLVRKGLIPGAKFGGGWRFSKDEIMKVISRGQALAAPDEDLPADKEEFK